MFCCFGARIGSVSGCGIQSSMSNSVAIFFFLVRQRGEHLVCEVHAVVVSFV